MTREALRGGGPRSMSPPKSHAVARRTTSMPKRSKSSGDAPVEPTPDVEAPASDGAAAERARSAARKTGPEMRGGQDQHRGEPAHPGVPLAPPGIVPESDVRVHTPAAAAPLPAHGLVNEGLGELPWAYGDARLVGLVRDPTTLFIYWDFSPQQIEQAFAGLGRARAMIKLWNSRNGGGDLVRETEVHLDARGWYLRELPPGLELRAELWAVGERGARLMRAARPARLPPAAPSEQLEAFYLRLALDQPITGGIPVGRPLNYGGSAPAGWGRRLQPRAVSGPGFRGPFRAGPPGPPPPRGAPLRAARRRRGKRETGRPPAS